MSQHAFEAEVAQVLDLVIHSLYRNKEIFLRELISNASDALDKRRFVAVTDSSADEGHAPEIQLIPDVEAKTLSIVDNGVGMSREELVQNLGTIAHSGTKSFLEQLEAGRDGAELIGQFGVGFYSAFLVSERVEVVSRALGSEEATRWSSTASEGFSVDPAERDQVGTTICLHLKEGQEEFLGTYRLRNLVKRYSDYISHPILLAIDRPPSSEEDQESESEQDALAPGEHDFEVINQDGALWKRPAEEITEEQYQQFYQHLSFDWEPPLAHTHFSIEGTQQFTALLYLPAKAPFDLFDREAKHGVKLFVKRVFIMDDASELLPVWLRFIRGVIDSDDLPLNVSRDVLQDSRAAQIIRKQVTKKALDLLAEMATERPEDYAQLWTQFGKVLKEGLHNEPDHKDRLAKLLRFETTHADGLTSLEEYVSRMPEGQSHIYYVLGANRRLVESSPHLEGLKKRGFEALLLTDPIDQWAVEGLKEFDDKPLTSAANANLDLDEDSDEETKKAAEARAEALQPLTAKFQEVLGDRVAEVKLSTRLDGSPVCLVIPDGGLPSHIERLLRAHNRELPPTPRILELNPSHPIIVHLEENAASERTPEYIELLFDQALLVEGSPIDDPARFAKQLSGLMQSVLGAG